MLFPRWEVRINGLLTSMRSRWLDIAHVLFHEFINTQKKKQRRLTITASSLPKFDQQDNFTRRKLNVTLPFPLPWLWSDRKIGTVLRTNQIAGFVTVHSWKKYLHRFRCVVLSFFLSFFLSSEGTGYLGWF